MPIQSSDLLFKLSVTTGTAGNQNAQGNPNNSLGTYISTTQITNNTLNNLFSNITGDQSAAGITKYRCIFVHNAHATLTLQSPVVWISASALNNETISIATDNVGVTNLGSSSAQATNVANETTAPSAVSAFSTPTTKGTGLSLGSIGPGQVAAVWVKQVVTAGATAANSESVTIKVEGDTAA